MFNLFIHSQRFYNAGYPVKTTVKRLDMPPNKWPSWEIASSLHFRINSMQTQKKENVLIENVCLLSNRKFQIFHKNVITAIPATSGKGRERKKQQQQQ